MVLELNHYVEIGPYGRVDYLGRYICLDRAQEGANYSGTLVMSLSDAETLAEQIQFARGEANLLDRDYPLALEECGTYEGDLCSTTYFAFPVVA